MSQREPPPPRGYVAETLSNVWAALRAVLRAAVVRHTADDAPPAAARAAPPLVVDRAGRPLASASAPAGPPRPRSSPPSPAAGAGRGPPLCALPPGEAPPGHSHGALVGLAEGLERAVLAPPPGGGAAAKEALALAHEEMHADRLGGDPFRRAIAAAPR
ncbi:hypothetical protein Rsub_01519 [Raphidocelis subcapitata]|uniref:Uncharacterized protein n=1 Tax=Raphidocelis subcapitata TaxID=307507 RepID=A0A2V0NTX6_9CHLO|nr:hypothetical protein Rsub_01519 [Raphidocelis subcapitata]|eukprot:GBF89020.1 hypothetical protein Rsub_01519 [Raphidocelis subcapitata]